MKVKMRGNRTSAPCENEKCKCQQEVQRTCLIFDALFTDQHIGLGADWF